MKESKIFNKENLKKLLNLVCSVGAIAIFNMVIQFLLYPRFEQRLGSDAFGVAQSIISLLAITAGSCGYAVNCARLLGVEKKRTVSSDYNLILLGMGLICSAIGIGYLFYLNHAHPAFGIATPISCLLYVLLIFATMLRYYADVDFRISTKFVRYMIFYVLISAGYVLGLIAFKFTNFSGNWMLALLVGEVAAFVFVCFGGTIFRPPFFKPTKAFPLVLSSIGFLLVSSLIDNLTLHADRILLLAITKDGSAVTIYYIASLVGKVIAMLTVPLNALIISYLVRYKGGLTKKLWFPVIAASLVLGGVALVGCLIVSPSLIDKLYRHDPDILVKVSPYLFPAILGQICYFISGVLMIVLLRFKGEKKQFIFNTGYAVEFLVCVIVGTVLYGLDGFVWAVLIANLIRFLAALIWGFVGNKRQASVEA